MVDHLGIRWPKPLFFHGFGGSRYLISCELIGVLHHGAITVVCLVKNSSEPQCILGPLPLNFGPGNPLKS